MFEWFRFVCLNLLVSPLNFIYIAPFIQTRRPSASYSKIETTQVQKLNKNKQYLQFCPKNYKNNKTYNVKNITHK